MMTKTEYHVPVLLEECIKGLAIKPEGVYLDCTLGGGGHFRKILDSLNKDGIAIGIDRDVGAIQWVRDHIGELRARMILEHCIFSGFDTILKKNSIKSVDGILLDLGVSSRQIDDLQRGFSYKVNTKLDMRMNPMDDLTAEELIAESNENTLARILKDYGEIRNPQRMAGAIVRFSKKRRIVTSADLRECLENEYGAAIKFKVLSKVFQALRIAVNNELEELQTCLIKAVEFLNKGGRLVIVAYHSLEDRIVKNFMRNNERQYTRQIHETICNGNNLPLLKRINRKVYRASQSEIERNRRARSARLRIAEKVL